MGLTWCGVQRVEVDADAWANLDDKDPAEEAAPADGPQDDLWQEFRSRDQVANDKVGSSMTSWNGYECCCS